MSLTKFQAFTKIFKVFTGEDFESAGDISGMWSQTEPILDDIQCSKCEKIKEILEPTEPEEWI